jgi:hypothetical protein
VGRVAERRYVQWHHTETASQLEIVGPDSAYADEHPNHTLGVSIVQQQVPSLCRLTRHMSDSLRQLIESAAKIQQDMQDEAYAAMQPRDLGLLTGSVP